MPAQLNKIPEVKLKLDIPKGRVGKLVSEIDFVKSLNSTKQAEIIQHCKDDIAYVEEKYNRKKLLPQWQTPKQATRLLRMYKKFKLRRINILEGLGEMV